MTKQNKMGAFSAGSTSGFASPAEDFFQRPLDLNEKLVKNPAATFFVKVENDPQIVSKIVPDDVLVVDRSVKPINGSVVVGVLDGKFVVKKIHRKGGKFFLRCPGEKQSKKEASVADEFSVWGVVTNVIHTP